LTLGFGVGVAVVPVEEFTGNTDWGLLYRPVPALVPTVGEPVGSGDWVRSTAGLGLTPTTGTPPGATDWTIRGGED
jgi:hypothetical protein